MKKASVLIKRFDPSVDTAPGFEEFTVPWEEDGTVLSALLYIREHVDSSLAFRFGCRFRFCGLCAMNINGRPGLACLTNLEKEVTLAPLNKFEVIRDLVVDRDAYFRRFGENYLYISGHGEQLEPESIIEPDARRRLVSCVDCLTCVACCPEYQSGDAAFGGPHLFVRLAMLHLDPRDNRDRPAQALRLGIDRCRDCRLCHCPNGIPIYRDAVGLLLRKIDKLRDGGS